MKVVLDFLCYLFDRLNLKPTTIEGYRSMLGPVFRARGIDLAADRTLSDLLASFRTQRPRGVPTLPDWDVAFVLYCLTKAPWEPLREISLQRLTLKTFFLILLASGRRRSDIAAIDVSRVAFGSNGSVSLYPVRDFMPKTRAAVEGGRAFSPIVIPPLVEHVGRNEPDSMLCPVRALRIYLDRTKAIRKSRNRLFISYQPNRVTDISPITLSRWVKVLVRSVYKESGADDRCTYKISAHQVRHISMSLASRSNIPLEYIVRAGMWTNSTTFIGYYLSNAAELQDQSARFRLGSLIVAQTKV